MHDNVVLSSDNHYVPNLTIGPMVCKALRDHGVKADIDVHLMVQPVDQMIQVSVVTTSRHIYGH
jgi:ribulose-phosphate 3-epimerase